jgi:hypothetical protein
MALNRKWHQQKRMPENPTKCKRVLWHIEPAKHSRYRPIPKALQKEIDGRQPKQNMVLKAA